MSLNVFDRTQLAEFNVPDTTIPLIIGDSSLDTSGLYITGLTAVHKPTVQVLAAADASIWVNSFGQRPSPTQLNGIIVPTSCEDGQDTQAHVRRSLLRIYKKYKINSGTTPLQMSFHGMVLKGFFLDLGFSNAQGQLTKAMNFKLVFLSVVESALGSNELGDASFS